MVRIGSIGEGVTEQILLESRPFQEWLNQNGLMRVGLVINAGGAGNLLPDGISPYRIELVAHQADVLIILTDLDNDSSVGVVKQRIGEHEKQLVIIAVRAVEAWFLSDTETLSQLMDEVTSVDYPEQSENPFEEIRQLFITKTGRGIGTKHMLARRMLKYGFTIEGAARHPNCPSARYFLTKLKAFASAN